MKVLVTGGAGYIGSHTVVELVAAGHEVVILDNFSNSSPVVLERLKQTTGRDIPVVRMDIRDPAIDGVFADGEFDAVIHFAALKAVGESVAEPLKYYDVNVGGTVHLLQSVIRHNVPRFVFSSSATVYGEPEEVQLKETAPLRPVHPYGAAKLMCERILQDTAAVNPGLKFAILRYFNPVGAHESGLIGEDPNDVPNNLMPFVSQVAVGRREKLRVFGDDYETHDGTGVRDYIHVVDLADAHIAALNALESQSSVVVNVGTGSGTSVLDLVKTFQSVTNIPIPYEIVARRPGDLAAYFADPALASELIGWRARRDIADMCRDTWRWQSMNPNGYAG